MSEKSSFDIKAISLVLQLNSDLQKLFEFKETVAVMCIELYKQNMKQKRAAASLLKIDDDSNTMHFTFIALWLCLCFLGGIRYEETYKYFFTTIST